MKVLSQDAWVMFMSGTFAGEKKKVKHAVIGDVVRAALAPKSADLEVPEDGGAPDDQVSEVASSADEGADVKVGKLAAADIFAKFGALTEY